MSSRCPAVLAQFKLPNIKNKAEYMKKNVSLELKEEESVDVLNFNRQVENVYKALMCVLCVKPKKAQ